LCFHLLAQTGVSLSQQFKDSRIPGPRLRISGNAIDILGGHEDAIGYNPEQHVLPNANYANNADELVAVMRQQFKEGADFIKIYETGADSLRDGNSRLHFSIRSRNWTLR
jgi:hypothetical protein